MAENGFSVTENVYPTFEDDQKAFSEEMMEDLNETEENIQGSDNFMELYEESLKSIHEGKVIKGEIVQIDKEFVLVDIGYKSEGQIRIAEFVNLEAINAKSVGDTVSLFIYYHQTERQPKPVLWMCRFSSSVRFKDCPTAARSRA